MTSRDHALNLFDEYYDLLANVVPDMSLKGRRMRRTAAQGCAMLFIEHMQQHCNEELTQYWRDVEAELQILDP